MTDAKPEARFTVIDNRDGCVVEAAFVLLPETDSAARTAMAAYAEATRNSGVARFIRAWLQRIHLSRLKRNGGRAGGVE